MGKIFNFNLGRNPQKCFSHKRRDYESVDEKSISQAMSQKKKNSVANGLNSTAKLCIIVELIRVIFKKFI